jgi:hypothetical protein
MIRTALLLSLCAAPALAVERPDETFYGWSKDGTWYVWQAVTGPNETTELYFCQSDPAVEPTWPKDLNELEKESSPKNCVRFTDPNRAPYGWKAQVALPKPATSLGKSRVLMELIYDGEQPGYVIETGDKDKEKKTVCYASGLNENSKLGLVYWHPAGKWVAAFVDGHFTHCDQPLKASAAEKPAKPEKPVKPVKGAKKKTS